MRPPSSDQTESEAIVMAPLLFAAALMLSAWVAGLVGVPIAPWPLTVFALAASAALARWALRFEWPIDRARLWGCVAVTAASLAYVSWLAWPWLLPLTDGPDLIHHLTLIHFIQHWHALPRDPALAPYLAEMRAYTPGSHLLAAVGADLVRLDAIRIVHPLMALAVALKAGFLYNVFHRLLPEPLDRAVRSAIAVAGTLLMFVPHAYVLQPVVWFGFYSQVIAETCALGMVWALVAWWQRPSRARLALFAAAGAAASLCWPVLVGPPVAAMSVAILVRDGDGAGSKWRATHLGARALDGVVAIAPVAAVMLVHSAVNPAAAGILRSGGFAVTPSIEVLGWGLLAVTAIGTIAAARQWRRQVPLLLFAVASIAQVAALAVLQWRLHATNLYFALKSMHLVVDAATIMGGLAVGWLAASISPRVHEPLRRALWVAPLLVLVWLWNGDLPRRPMVSFVAPPLVNAGAWAKANLPAACVEYLTPRWQTGYWLHFDVLGNARVGPRLTDETFVYRENVGKWILPGSLPYAIVEDVTRLPREAAEHTTILQRFGHAAVVERSDGLGKCEDRTPPIDQMVKGPTG